MARMLDALRRLEATNRLVAPAVLKPPPDAAESAAPPSPAEGVDKKLQASESASESVSLIDHDEPPYEPTFGPLVSWNRHDDAFNYASHAIDEDLDALDALAHDAAEAISPARLVTKPISATVERAPVTLDEFDPVAVVNEHAAGDDSPETYVAHGDASTVAADVLSTIQFAEHWATISLEDYGVDQSVAATQYPPPADDFALLPAAAHMEPKTDPLTPMISPAPALASEVEAIADSSAQPPTTAPAHLVVDEYPRPAEAPPRKKPPSPPPSSTSKERASIDIARPQPSPAELSAMLDLNNATLLSQYTQLGERMLRELTATTKTCASLLSIEHQPHVTDVALRTAITLCRGGKQVLLIDAALADKQLTSGLAMPVEFGLSEVLKGRVPWQQAVRATATPGLCVLPAGRLTPPRLADDDHRLKDVLKELTSQWDLVLLDGGSLAETSARYVAAAARNVYLVVRLGETEADATEKAAHSLTLPEVALRGCIVTNAT